jgi:hypothetical protein
MDIIVRKVDGKIVVVSGDARLDAQLNVSAQAKVKFLGSGKEVFVNRNAAGDLIEVNPDENKQLPINTIEPCPVNSRDTEAKNDPVEELLETTANAFFKGKDKAHAAPISYGELIWIMRSLLTAAQPYSELNLFVSNLIAEVQSLSNPLESAAQRSDLVKRLWESDSASALTNEAAREIEKISAELEKAKKSSQTAWLQVEAAFLELQRHGVAVSPAVVNE